MVCYTTVDWGTRHESLGFADNCLPGLFDFRDIPFNTVCWSDSQRAEEIARGLHPGPVFYIDRELRSVGYQGDNADLPGINLGRLRREWLGHPAGTLVMEVFERDLMVYFFERRHNHD